MPSLAPMAAGTEYPMQEKSTGARNLLGPSSLRHSMARKVPFPLSVA